MGDLYLIEPPARSEFENKNRHRHFHDVVQKAAESVVKICSFYATLGFTLEKFLQTASN